MNRTHVRAAAFAAALSVTACSHEPLFRSEAELRQKTLTVQGTTVPATLARDAAVQSSPADAAPTLATLPRGAEVWAADKAVHGYRRIKTADGKSGYVAEPALQIGVGHPAPLQPQQAATPAEPKVSGAK
ncbi:SH3 domain-containing protein [Anaeromyxobacter paludicola]|uniref:SH3 domain-containing protein n=1 Tax=Anaeromyxobacter paludicola TaxID=2918171 RepID=A0ABM7XDI3_9BACT|nr:hypothetical protein [Anaeromyxobacter paludicola]BDG09931.1 hypothetical protein AMPC_30440 [Anaeromyxobacter paludicola]